jgi:hypothetical protein
MLQFCSFNHPLVLSYIPSTEILDEEEFGESSASRAQDGELTAAEELGLMVIYFQIVTTLSFLVLCLKLKSPAAVILIYTVCSLAYNCLNFLGILEAIATLLCLFFVLTGSVRHTTVALLPVTFISSFTKADTIC